MATVLKSKPRLHPWLVKIWIVNVVILLEINLLCLTVEKWKCNLAWVQPILLFTGQTGSQKVHMGGPLKGTFVLHKNVVSFQAYGFLS